MCGINGVIFKSEQDEHTVKKTLTVMNDLIIHRGPDDDGAFIESDDFFFCAVSVQNVICLRVLLSQQLKMNSRSVAP